jgi:hypothetical protein
VRSWRILSLAFDSDPFGYSGSIAKIRVAMNGSIPPRLSGTAILFAGLHLGLGCWVHGTLSIAALTWLLCEGGNAWNKQTWRAILGVPGAWSGDILHHHFPDVVAFALQHCFGGVDSHPDNGLR